MADLLETVFGDVLKADDAKGVSSFYALACAVGADADTLAQSAHFVGGRRAPNFAELRVPEELAVLKHLARLVVVDSHGPLGE